MAAQNHLNDPDLDQSQEDGEQRREIRRKYRDLIQELQGIFPAPSKPTHIRRFPLLLTVFGFCLLQVSAFLNFICMSKSINTEIYLHSLKQ